MDRNKTAASPLLHTTWWVALGVLALNDTILKGAGLLPAEITGKLSDFAGLIVAPVLLAVLLKQKEGKGLFAVHAAIGGVFALINLSPSFAAGVDLLMSPLHWRSWTDPTDLIALPMLAVSWRLVVTEPRAIFTKQVGFRELVLQLGMLNGLIFCMATSQCEQASDCDQGDVCSGATCMPEDQARQEELDASSRHNAQDRMQSFEGMEMSVEEIEALPALQNMEVTQPTEILDTPGSECSTLGCDA